MADYWVTSTVYLAVALCSIHVQLYDWLQVCLCFWRGIYRISLWNKHDTTTVAKNFEDLSLQKNRRPTYSLPNCPFVESVDWLWRPLPMFISLKVSRMCCALLCSSWAISRCIMKLWATMSKVSLSCGWYRFK